MRRSRRIIRRCRQEEIKAAVQEFCMDYSVIPWTSWRSACETKVPSRRTCMPWCLGGGRPESQSTSHEPESFNDKEPNRSSTLVKQWNMVLQCRAQSSRRGSPQYRTCCYWTDPLPMVWRLLYCRERILAVVRGCREAADSPQTSPIRSSLPTRRAACRGLSLIA